MRAPKVSKAVEKHQECDNVTLAQDVMHMPDYDVYLSSSQRGETNCGTNSILKPECLGK